MVFCKRVFLTILIVVYLIQEYIWAPDSRPLTEDQAICVATLETAFKVEGKWTCRQIFKKILRKYTISDNGIPDLGVMYIRDVASHINTDSVEHPLRFCNRDSIIYKALCVAQLKGAIYELFILETQSRGAFGEVFILENTSIEVIMQWVFTRKSENNLLMYNYEYDGKVINASTGGQIINYFVDYFSYIHKNLDFDDKKMRTINHYCRKLHPNLEYKSRNKTRSSNAEEGALGDEAGSSNRNLENTPVYRFDLNRSPPKTSE